MEDLSSGTKKEAEQLEVGRGALYALPSIMRSVFGTRVFSALVLRRFNSSTRGHLPPHGRGRRKYCAVNVLTCPCCSAAPPLLDCSPWTDSCCCIHSSVSLQKRRETADEDSLLYSRLTDRRNFSWETTWAPPLFPPHPQVFPPSKM